MSRNTFHAMRATCALVRIGAALAVVLAVALPSGCGYSNPHGRQDTPPILRIRTVPSGAIVILEEMNLKLTSPCDLPTELDPDDEISVSKDGYLPYKGPLGGLREIARGTYEIELKPVGTAPPQN